MATSKSLKTAIKKEVAEAQDDAKTGDVSTQDTGHAPSGGKVAKAPVDLPTNARSHLPEA